MHVYRKITYNVCAGWLDPCKKEYLEDTVDHRTGGGPESIGKIIVTNVTYRVGITF